MLSIMHWIGNDESSQFVTCHDRMQSSRPRPTSYQNYKVRSKATGVRRSAYRRPAGSFSSSRPSCPTMCTAQARLSCVVTLLSLPEPFQSDRPPPTPALAPTRRSHAAADPAAVADEDVAELNLGEKKKKKKKKVVLEVAVRAGPTPRTTFPPACSYA